MLVWKKFEKYSNFFFSEKFSNFVVLKKVDYIFDYHCCPVKEF